MKSNKKNILIFIDWFKPAYKAGGPIQSVYNIIENLKEDSNFYICTSAYDLGEEKPLDSIITDKWVEYSSDIQIIYLTHKNQNKSIFRDIINHIKFDYYYMNGVFSFKFSILPLYLLRKKSYGVVIAPRGMLGAGALQNKSLKKNIFITISKGLGLYKSVTWHVSSTLEQAEVQNEFNRTAKTVIAPNFANKYEVSFTQTKKLSGQLELFFISRISKKKNLLYALKQLNKPYEGNIIYFIYGPIEDKDYWEECSKLIETLPSNIKVEYKGVLHPSEVHKTLNQHHYLFLPTLNENYGHVIIESLLSAKPAIISDQTPWNDLEINNAGWSFALTQQKELQTTIQKCITLSQDEYDFQSKSALKYATNHINDQSILKANKSLFNL